MTDRRTGTLGQVANGAFVTRASSPEGPGAIALGPRATLVNDGTVTTEGFGAVTGLDGLLVLNRGTIGDYEVVADAIRAGDRLTVINAEGARVWAQNSAIIAGSDATVLNDGLIEAFQFHAIFAGDRARIVNGTAGEIRSLEDSITAGSDLSLVNAGLIEAQGDGKIEAGPRARVVNEGTISLGFSGIVGRGDLDVENRGRLSASGGTGEAIRSWNTLALVNEGEVIGSIWAGYTMDIANRAEGVIRGNARADTGHAILDNAGLFDGHVEALQSVRGSNSGTITDGITALYGAIEIVNTGTIRSSRTGLDGRSAGNVVLDNSGSITAAGDAVFSNETAIVTNTGTIAGGQSGISMIDGRIANSGSIVAGRVGVASEYNVSLDNSGLIAAGGTGVSTPWVATFDNRGTIRGGEDGLRADLGLFGTNDGLIAGSRYGVRGGAEGASLTNRGRIQGTLTGVATTGYAGIQNAAGATIRGGSGAGVEVANADLRNSGLIEGRVGVRYGSAITTPGPVQIENRAGGTIRGRSGTAMILSSDDDRVFARAGSLVDGSIRMGAGNDEIVVEAGATVRGDILLGTGDDRFVFERSMFQTVLTNFGIIDGGLNFNTTVFRGFGLDDLRTRAVAGGFFVSLVDGAARLRGTFLNFDAFELDDATIALRREPGTPGSVPAPIPVPAALPLMLAGLGGLALLRRGRAARARRA